MRDVLDAVPRLRVRIVFRGTYTTEIILPRILKEPILAPVFEPWEEGSALRVAAIPQVLPTDSALGLPTRAAFRK